MQRRRGHGEGSIYQRESDGKWCAVVELAPDAAGKRRRKTVYGKTRREVADKLRKVQAQAEQGAAFDNDKATVNDALDRRINSPKLAQSSRETYDKFARLYIRPKIGKVRLDKLSTKHLQGVIDAVAATGNGGSAHIVWTVLAGALRPLVRAGLLPAHILDLVEVPASEGHDMQPLTVEQARSLLAVLRGDKHEFIYRLALSLGLRKGEVLGLHKTDLDRSRRVLTVQRQVIKVRGGLQVKTPKTRSGIRALAMPDGLFTDLVEFIDADESLCPFIFHTRNDTPLNPAEVGRLFQPLKARAGLPPALRFHDLRHSCATFLIAQGVHPKVIQEILGHSDIGITMNVYGHVLPEVSRDAAERLGRLFGDGATPGDGA